MPPLTVGYDATAAVTQQAGIGRYARELLRALGHLPECFRYKVVFESRGANVPLPQLGDQFSVYPIPASDRLMNAVWHRARLPIPIEVRTGRIDVFHSPDFSMAPSIAPSLVTVHDLAFEAVPQLSYPSLARYLHRVVPRGVRRARAVIVPSSHTKAEMLARLGTDEGKVHVIPEGVSGVFRPDSPADDAAVLQRRGITRPYIFTHSTLEPRKNVDRLLEAISLLQTSEFPHVLLLAGRLGWLYEPIFETHARLELGDRARFLTDCSDQELAALLRQADLAVYPSLYEGFGLPVLEALACGAPTVCSGNTSFPEIAGTAADLFDPWDVDDIAAVMRAVLEDGDRQAALRRQGPVQARTFTWERCARATVEVYNAVGQG